MKKDNPQWGCKKIANEFKKINIKIHYTTVNKIIQTFRKQGKIPPNGSLLFLEKQIKKIV